MNQHARAVSVLPQRPLLVQSRDGQSVHCDFVLQNATAEELMIDSIEVSVLDAQGALALRRFINGNGMPGAIETLPARRLPPGGSILVYNPLHSFADAVSVSKLHFTFLFNAGENWRKYASEIDVTPEPYRTKTRLVPPLAGRVLVHDGHDFYAHHRRLDLTLDFIAGLGVKAVSGRYAYDLVVIDDEGRTFKGNGTNVSDWFGWAAPVRAPADGTIVEVVGDIPDNVMTAGDPGHASPEALANVDPAVGYESPDKLPSIAGNHVIIDHADGEWSLIAHFETGSLSVRKGDRVKAGQVIGRMGMSGDSRFPHVHYQLQAGPGMFADEGVPSTFTGLTRVMGSKLVAWPSGIIDSGDIVIAK